MESRIDPARPRPFEKKKNMKLRRQVESAVPDAAPLPFTQISECDRVAKCLNRRDTMLPGRPGWTVEQVGRPRLSDEGKPLPLLSGFSSKPEGAG